MPQVEREVIKRRAAELREAVAVVRTQWLAGLVDKTLSVLAEKDGTGYSQEFARVASPKHVSAGEIFTLRPSRIKEGMLE